MERNQILLGRRERKEQTKQGLISSAIDLFIAKGYDETTIDDIVANADVAKVTFYYYFKSKEEIALEIKKAVQKKFWVGRKDFCMKGFRLLKFCILC